MAKTSKGQRTRTRIYKAATEIIGERGLEATTMRLIAERANLSPGAAYHYVRSKDELVLGLYGHTQEQLSAHAADVAQRGGTLNERLKAMLLGGLELLEPQRELLGSLAAVVMAPNSTLSPFTQNTRQIREQAINNFRVILGKESTQQLAELFWMLWICIFFLCLQC